MLIGDATAATRNSRAGRRSRMQPPFSRRDDTFRCARCGRLRGLASKAPPVATPPSPEQVLEVRALCHETVPGGWTSGNWGVQRMDNYAYGCGESCLVVVFLWIKGGGWKWFGGEWSEVCIPSLHCWFSVCVWINCLWDGDAGLNVWGCINWLLIGE